MRMKNILLLFLSVMAFSILSQAQYPNVYSSGSLMDGTNTRAAVYRNGTLLYSSSLGNSESESTSVVVNPSNQDVYWVRNSVSPTTIPTYGDIMRNDETFLNNYTMGTRISKLYWYDNNSSNDPESCLFSAGYTFDSDQYIAYATIWRGSSDEPYLGPDFGSGYYSIANGICVSGDASYFDVWYCGKRYGSQGVAESERATVWKNNYRMYTLSDVRSEANDIAYYNGDVYTCGHEIVGEYFIAKVWKNNSVLYTLGGDHPDTSSDAFKIKVDGGDVYVYGYAYTDTNGYRCIIWKNGEPIYDTPDWYDGIVVNSDGVYYGVSFDEGTGYCQIRKDDQVIYTVQNCEYITDIYLTEECSNPQPRQLPYFEGFEMGATDWACWTTTDEGDNYDNQGIAMASYWHRLGVNGEYMPKTGAYCAYHRYEHHAQEGWLISPPITIPSNRIVELTFQTLEGYASDMEFEGVKVSTTANPNDFQQVWSQSDPSSNWKEVTVDLSAYQGQTIYIAFVYIGTNAHDWCLDDVRVEATGVNEYTITTAVNPAGAGTVEGAGVYPQGASTYLTATPNTGWTFSHWNDGITTNPRSITVNGDATYTAHFLQQNYTITVAADPPQGGTVSGGGSYHYGDTATLTATANSGYQFQAWSDGSTQNPHPVTVTGNADYKAIFSEVGTIYYNVSANVRPANAGSVDGTGAYPAGTTITLTATANPGYIFSHWNDGITSNPRTVTVNSNLSFTANFSQGTVTYYSVNLICNSSEGSVEGGGFYPAGSTITIQAIPNEGYFFEKWSDESTRNPRQITVNNDITLAAFFQGTGVDEGELNPMTLYPNPAKESIRILGIEANSAIEIYNSLGMLVKVVSAGPDQEIGVSDLSSGLYLVRCGSRTLRFVKGL